MLGTGFQLLLLNVCSIVAGRAYARYSISYCIHNTTTLSVVLAQAGIQKRVDSTQETSPHPYASVNCPFLSLLFGGKK